MRQKQEQKGLAQLKVCDATKDLILEASNVAPYQTLLSLVRMGAARWITWSKFFGMPCYKFEEEIMALFASIEASHNESVLSKGSPSTFS